MPTTTHAGFMCLGAAKLDTGNSAGESLENRVDKFVLLQNQRDCILGIDLPVRQFARQTFFTVHGQPPRTERCGPLLCFAAFLRVQT